MVRSELPFVPTEKHMGVLDLPTLIASRSASAGRPDYAERQNTLRERASSDDEAMGMCAYLRAHIDEVGLAAACTMD